MNGIAYRTVGIVAKPQPLGHLGLLDDLVEWLTARGIGFILDPQAAALAGGKGYRVLDRADLPSNADLLVVLGGDGTLLSVARHLDRKEVPILGVNLGSLGFITEISAAEMIQTLQACLEGRASVQRRMMLQAAVTREGKQLAAFHCLNDVVINKAALARIIEIRVDVGGLWLTDMRADGLIIATPTGSTAYNLAAGGPIIAPGVDGLVLSPLCPHTLTMRPVIVEGDSSIEVTLLRESGQVLLTADGQMGHPLEAGDLVTVTRSPHCVPLVSSQTRDYFALLREKLGWGSGRS